MRMIRIVGVCSVAAIALAAVALAVGCNTVEGIGKDLQVLTGTPPDSAPPPNPYRDEK